jgi:hypothetical protein
MSPLKNCSATINIRRKLTDKEKTQCAKAVDGMRLTPMDQLAII